MDNFNPNIGDHFIHIPNKTKPNPKHLIYTQMGYLPNDIRAEKIAWLSGFHCGNGMKNCMTIKQFSTWWANQTEKKYKEYINNN
jgi:hypothetical protein